MEGSMITIDFETKRIEKFKPCLPEPVGLAIRYPDGTREYMAWGHQSGNNCTFEDAKGVMQDLWRYPLLTHNGGSFDLPVAQHWFSLPDRDPLLNHDTLYLAFLHNPHARSLSLKDLANDLCKLPPAEQRDLQDWILANTTCRSRKEAGAYIADAPVDLVAPYAIGDVERTWALWEYLRPRVLPDMQSAYEREQRVAPILAGMRNMGVRLDRQQLAADTEAYSAELENLDSAVRDRLHAPGLNPDSDADVVVALRANGFDRFMRTNTGKFSASKDSLDYALRDDPELRAVLSRRSTVATYLRTFMQPWLEQSAETGRLHASYNSLRNPDGFGTRTGRLSSSEPNLQNVPRDSGDYVSLRAYLLPEDGHVWVTGDFKSQEPRVAAHFEDGALLEAYQSNPELDQYLWIAELAGVVRKEAKVIFLALLYAMGVAKLAAQLGILESDASMLRDKIRMALPGIVRLSNEVMWRFRKGQSIRTLGGRVYYCEPRSGGNTFEYKALNVLVQGSAADQGKEALVYIHDRLLPGERILGMVHDEISVSCPPERVDAVKQLLAEAANALPCDCPMLMDCGHGPNWSSAK
jgi:DNA polymerase I-like protein with 3'-5' exonuclease and polymerase domains